MAIVWILRLIAVSPWQYDWGRASAALELGCTLLEEGGGTLALVFGPGEQAEIGGLEDEAFIQAGFHSLVGRFESEADGDRAVGSDFAQDRFSAGNQVSGRDDFVDQADAIGLVGADHPSLQQELESTALAGTPREPLRAASAGQKA